MASAWQSLSSQSGTHLRRHPAHYRSLRLGGTHVLSSLQSVSSQSRSPSPSLSMPSLHTRATLPRSRRLPECLNLHPLLRKHHPQMNRRLSPDPLRWKFTTPLLLSVMFGNPNGIEVSQVTPKSTLPLQSSQWQLSHCIPTDASARTA